MRTASNDKTRQVNLVKVYRGRFPQEKNLWYTDVITEDNLPPSNIITIDARRDPRYKPGKQAVSQPRKKIKQLAILVKNIPEEIKTHNVLVRTFIDRPFAPKIIDEQVISSRVQTHKKIKVMAEPAQDMPIMVSVRRIDPNVENIVGRPYETTFTPQEVEQAKALVIDYHNMTNFSDIPSQEKAIYLENEQRGS